MTDPVAGPGVPPTFVPEPPPSPAPTPAPAPAPTLVLPPELAAALGALGPWGALAGLALTFGVPFVTHLISNSKNNTPVTLEEWNALKAKIATPYEDL